MATNHESRIVIGDERTQEIKAAIYDAVLELTSRLPDPMAVANDSGVVIQRPIKDRVAAIRGLFILISGE